MPGVAVGGRSPDRGIQVAGRGAFLIDPVFGYGPAYAGFWLALLELSPDKEFAVLVDRGSELLTGMVGYLTVARFLLVKDMLGGTGTDARLAGL